MWILCRTFERGSGLSAVHVGPKNNTPRHKRGSTAAAPGQIFKVGGSVLLLGFLALPRSFLTVIKHFSFQIFFFTAGNGTARLLASAASGFNVLQ